MGGVGEEVGSDGGVGARAGVGIVAACSTDKPKENRAEERMGGSTGGRSDVGKGTAGSVVDGTGLGDGKGRGESRDARRMEGRRGDEEATYGVPNGLLIKFEYTNPTYELIGKWHTMKIGKGMAFDGVMRLSILLLRRFFCECWRSVLTVIQPGQGTGKIAVLLNHAVVGG